MEDLLWEAHNLFVCDQAYQQYLSVRSGSHRALDTYLMTLFSPRMITDFLDVKYAAYGCYNHTVPGMEWGTPASISPPSNMYYV